MNNITIDVGGNILHYSFFHSSLKFFIRHFTLTTSAGLYNRTPVEKQSADITRSRWLRRISNQPRRSDGQGLFMCNILKKKDYEHR